MVLTKIMNVKDNDEYWERLSQMASMLQRTKLKGKAEYGLGVMGSEGGVQLYLQTVISMLTRKHKLNADKAQAISYCVSLCFPPFGSVGLEAIKRIVLEKGISTDNFEINAIEWILNNMGDVVAPVLDDALHAYYENLDSDPEVNLVRYCQMKCKEARELAKQGVRAGEALNEVFDCIEADFDPSVFYPLETETDIEVPDRIKEALEKLIEELAQYQRDHYGKSEEEAFCIAVYEVVDFPSNEFSYL